MNTFNHSTCEWEYQGGDDLSCEVSIKESVITISRCDKNTGTPVYSRKEMEANAHLIATAPNMLRELIKMFTTMYMTQDETYWMPIKDVIEKATGLSIEEVVNDYDELKGE